MKDETNHDEPLHSGKKMSTETIVLPGDDVTDVCEDDEDVLYIAENNSDVSNSSETETQKHVAATPASGDKKFGEPTSNKDLSERVYQWRQENLETESTESYGDTHIALSYWDKPCGQSSNNDLTTAALQQWIMSGSESNCRNEHDTPESLDVKKAVGRPKRNSEIVKYHECPLCGKSVQRLRLHMRMHTGDRPYQCSQCGQRFTQLGSLKKHQTLHSEEKPFQCGVCGKCFRCKSDLSLHSKLHTGKSFDCSYCSKSFVTQKAIDNHVRTHTGEKPFLCHVCGLSFSQEGNLSMHVKVHTGEKPYQCFVCIPNKYFATRTHLEKHTRTHTGEKPYTCATCQKSFSDRGYFMRHLAVHTGEKSHVCNVCNKAFTQRISLKRHSRIHTGEKPFECIVCREAFSLKRDLKRHSEKVHNTEKNVLPIKHTLTRFQNFPGEFSDNSIGHQY
ncbi:gastrula zinc finger protein XlCGF57.1-like isoform X2 [Periplaneta americana]